MSTTRRVPWLIGSVIGGRYRLRRLVGEGGMGEVWRADHLSSQKSLAIKLVDTDNRDHSDETLARFQIEARAASQIRSPHVIEILDHGVDGRVAFMVMELLLGESLEERLRRRGKLPPDEVAYILSEVALGIEKAHAAGVIHRDLKPSNIFLARQPDGHIVTKVLDFGVAKLLQAPSDIHLQTQAGAIIGTPSYMSPEQVLGRPVDARSDLWSLSIIAFECISGKRLIDGETLGEILLRICAAPLPLPSSVVAVPEGFDAWFERGTARDPDKRFQSAAELAAALRASLTVRGAPKPAASSAALSLELDARQGARPGKPAAPRPRPRRGAVRVLVLSLVGALMIAGAIGIYRKLRPNHGPRAPVTDTPRQEGRGNNPQ